MAYALWRKDGCETHTIAPAGFRILSALERCAQVLGHDLVLTCGCDSHPPDDPHTKGQAFDVRSHDLTDVQKSALLIAMMDALKEPTMDSVTPKDGGFVTRHFFGWLEHSGSAQEHFHFQQRNGVPYP